MFSARVAGGTGAGSKMRPFPGTTKCACGGFIAKVRHEQGATQCVRCESRKP